MLVATVPVITPVVAAMGFDPVWFGVFMMLLIETALITPPVGFNLFVVQGVRPRGQIYDVILGAAPFVVDAARHDRAPDRLPRPRALAARKSAELNRAAWSQEPAETGSGFRALDLPSSRLYHGRAGRVAERLKALVLKTSRRVTVSWVRIPPLPPSKLLKQLITKLKTETVPSLTIGFPIIANGSAWVGLAVPRPRNDRGKPGSRRPEPERASGRGRQQCAPCSGQGTAGPGWSPGARGARGARRTCRGARLRGDHRWRPEPGPPVGCACSTVIRPPIPRTSDQSFHEHPTTRSRSIRPG